MSKENALSRSCACTKWKYLLAYVLGRETKRVGTDCIVRLVRGLYAVGVSDMMRKRFASHGTITKATRLLSRGLFHKVRISSPLQGGTGRKTGVVALRPSFTRAETLANSIFGAQRHLPHLDGVCRGGWDKGVPECDSLGSYRHLMLGTLSLAYKPGTETYETTGMADKSNARYLVGYDSTYSADKPMIRMLHTMLSSTRRSRPELGDTHD